MPTLTELDIRLQPKQCMVLDQFESPQASWIGIGGGRGAAKSGGVQRIMLERRVENPGTIGAILMRNYDQVKRYHIDVMLRDYPELEPFYHKTDSKIVLPMEDGPDSEIHFTYAESLQDVIRRFRSASYFDLVVDQAEQFSEAELREIKQAVRWKNVPQGTCKLALPFNMGGVGIRFLSKKFHELEYNDRERASDYAFIHVYPWDNIEWSRPALLEDGFSTPEEQEYQYYHVMSEEERAEYCATRSDYGRNLNSQDESLRQRDWFGSWKSLEGAFFGPVFDRDSAVLDQEQVALISKPWHKRWLSQDWGRGHYCPTHWHMSGEMSPQEAFDVLGWQVSKPVKFVLTYREYIAGGAATSDEGGNRELAEQDIAREIVKRTPEAEREMLKAFFLSPDAFAKRSSANTIDIEIGNVLKAADMPRPTQADNDRKGGWGLMYNMCLETKRHAATDEYVWLISANCPELVRSIPLLMRNPKDLDDVIATDKGSAKLEIDVTDSARYGLKTMLSPGKKPKHVLVAEAVAKAHRMATERYQPQQGDVIGRYGAPPAMNAITPNTAAYLAHKKAEKSFAGGPIRIRKNWRRGLM